jgi:hypothetical protein
VVKRKRKKKKKKKRKKKKRVSTITIAMQLLNRFDDENNNNNNKQYTHTPTANSNATHSINLHSHTQTHTLTQTDIFQPYATNPRRFGSDFVESLSNHLRGPLRGELVLSFGELTLEEHHTLTTFLIDGIGLTRNRRTEQCGSCLCLQEGCCLTFQLGLLCFLAEQLLKVVQHEAYHPERMPTVSA